MPVDRGSRRSCRLPRSYPGALARRQLASAALDLAVVTHAEEGARRFLVGLFATDGYTVEVDFAPVARQAAPAAR